MSGARPAAPGRSRRRPRSGRAASRHPAKRPRTSTSGSCPSARGSRSARPSHPSAVRTARRRRRGSSPARCPRARTGGSRRPSRWGTCWRRPGAGLGEPLVAAQDARSALVIDFAGGQDHALGPVDRVVQREVIVRVLGRLGELARRRRSAARRPRAACRPSPRAACAGTATACRARRTTPRRCRHGLRPADVEARVDRRQFRALQNGRERRDQDDQCDERTGDLGRPDHRGRGVNWR